MTLEIITPTIGITKKKVKDLVISALMYSYPLSLIKLTNTINKKFTSGVTFQGVRRAVNSLLDEKILIKSNKEYQINQEWILKMKDFFGKLNDSYSSKTGGIMEIEEIGEEIKVYTMKNLLEADKLWNKINTNFFKEEKNSKKEKIYAQFAGHTWYVFGQMSEETEIVNLSREYKIKAFIVCNSNTVLDKWCKKYYEDIGVQFTTNKEIKKEDNSKYFGVYENYIIQLETPKEITKEIDEVYNNAKSFNSFDGLKLSKALLKESKIKLIVMKNNLLAEQLRKSVLNHFKKNKAN
jgi:hypothetical protein